MSPPRPVLEVENLFVTYGGTRPFHAVRDVSFSIGPGEAYGLIGESGSGKTTVAYSVIRHLNGAEPKASRLMLDGRDLLALGPEDLRAIRGREIAMVYQDPMNALNPMLKVGEQIAEALRQHLGRSRRQAWQESVELLRQVHLPNPELIAKRYPHQLSGGQQQRVVIAMALSCRPRLLIMDEPTTGLDVTTEAVILDLVNELRRTTGASILFISHNLAVVAKVCDRVGVLYAGELLEEGPTEAVLRQPRQPYTLGLLRALPSTGGERRRLSAIPGRLPDLRVVPGGCVFEPRCALGLDACRTTRPRLELVGQGHASACHRREENITQEVPAGPASLRPQHRHEEARLQVTGIRKVFSQRHGLPFVSKPATVTAIDDVTIAIHPGRTLAVVGESGSGKTTLARCIAGLLPPDRGSVVLEGSELAPLVGKRRRTEQQAIQYVFQNPDASLNPHRTVAQIIGRPLRLYGLASGVGIRKRVIELLETVQLSERYLERYPHELSGGEKQRVSIARAFAAEPSLVVCDEPTSALDISVQAAVLNELLDLQQRFGTSYLFVSHDLTVVRYLADEVVIMHQGKIVESGPTAAIFDAPIHPYTQKLLAAAPRIEAPAGIGFDTTAPLVLPRFGRTG